MLECYDGNNDFFNHSTIGTIRMSNVIHLGKNTSIDLKKKQVSLKHISAELGWTISANEKGYDLDVFAFLLDKNGTASSHNVCFYNNESVNNGAIVYGGDNRTGKSTSGANDIDETKESIDVNFDKLDKNIHTISIVVSIHDAERLKQSFKHVSHAFIRLRDLDTGDEFARFDLSEDMPNETGVIVGLLKRKENSDEFMFETVGAGVQGGIHQICVNYGLTPE